MFRVIFFAVLLFSTQTILAASYTLEVTEEELQQRVETIMPLERSQYFITVRLSKPTVKLLASNNRVGLSSNILASIPGVIQGRGRASVTGRIRYDSNRGAFYLDNPVIEQLQIDNLPKRHLPQVKNIAQQLLANTLSSQPLYTLNDKDFRQKFAKSMLKGISVKNKILLIELDAF